MPITRSADAPGWDLPGTLFTALASPSRGGSDEVALWRMAMQPGTPATPHSVTRTEVFVALSGVARVRLGEEPATELAAGDCLVVPPDVNFELGNSGAEPFQAVVCLPAGAQARMPGAEPFTPPWSL